MRVVIADSNRTSRATVWKWLTERRHEVEVVDTIDALASLVSESAPDSILLDCGFGDTGAPAVLKKIRAAAASPYIVAMLGAHPPSEIPALLAAGADDFLRNPCPKEEVVARVEAPLRLGKRVPVGTVTDTKAGQMLDWSADNDPTRLRFWRSTPELVSTAIGQMVGCKLGASPAGPVSQPAFAARIAMIGAGDAANLEISLAVGSHALREIAHMLTGDTTFERADLEDIVREMANQVAGVIKRGAGDDGCAYTLGLPITVAASSHGIGSPSQRMSLAYTVRGAADRLHVEMRTTPKNVQTVTANALREGMVLVRDLHNGAGALLVPSGTRLTSETATRIAKIVGKAAVIDVQIAA